MCRFVGIPVGWWVLVRPTFSPMSSVGMRWISTSERMQPGCATCETEDVKALGWIVTIVVCGGLVLTLDPVQVGLSTYAPFAQAVALRGLVAAVLVILSVLGMLIIAATRQRGGARGSGVSVPRRSPRLFTFVLVAVIVAAGHGGVIAARWWEHQQTPVTESDESLTVVSFNTHGNAGIVLQARHLIDEHTPKIIALQEVTAETAQNIADAASGSYQVFTAAASGSTVSHSALLVSDELGEYAQVEAPASLFASVIAEPLDGQGPVAMSVHPVPPMPRNMSTWRGELQQATDLCDNTTGAIVAGDFNATIDHGPLRETECLVATSTIASTWPASQPSWLGAAIDHVMVDGGQWLPLSAHYQHMAGSDHRAIVVQVVPAGQAG